MTGIERIAQAFEKAQTNNKAALMPYFTLGYPDLESSLDIIESIAEEADLLELGVPFSDPLADGPVIQKSTQVALDNGITAQKCIEMVKALRQKGVDTPAMMMGYYNPMLAYGLEAFVRDAAASGVDGFIVPDLPIEETEELAALAEKYGVALVNFLAPTSNSERIARTAKASKGFIYLVAITGITGTKEAVAGELNDLVSEIRSQTDVPVAVGFGINTPEAASKMGDIADGVIVGTALVRAVDNAEGGKEGEAAKAFVKSLKEGLSK